MPVMDCRYAQLKLTLDGLDSTHVPLVLKYQETYGRAGFPDDLGLFYFVPWISKTFGLSLDSSITLFLSSLLLIGAVIMGGSFLLLFKHWLTRTISICATLLLAAVGWRYSDVYIASYFCVASLVPLYILWDQKKQTGSLFLILIFSGWIIGYCNWIRSHSGTGVLLFIITWILCNKSLKEKLYCLSALFICTSIPYFHFRHLESERDAFLKEPNQQLCHPKWHNIYIGLGYLKNPYGIQYSDRIADEKARSIDPEVKNCSPEYERILRDQCLSLFKSAPLFILKTIAAKALFLCFKALLFLNFGLLFYFYVKPAFRTTLPFLVSGAFFSLPGILAVPFTAYVLGMVSLATLFGLYMTGLAIEKFSMKYVWKTSVK